MKKHNWKKAVLALLLTVCMSTQMAGIALADNETSASEDTKPVLELVEDDLPEEVPAGAKEAAEPEAEYADTDNVRVFIVLEDGAVLDSGYTTVDLAKNYSAMKLSDEIVENQEKVAAQISEEALSGEILDVRYHLTLLTNAVSANVKYGDIEKIREVDGVAEVYLVPKYDICETAEPNTITSGNMVGSYPTWESGYTGAGQRIAVIDTGIDADHPSFDGAAFDYGLDLTAKDLGTSVADYNLLDAAEIAEVLPHLNASQMSSGLTADKLFLSNKIAYAFNYVDENLDVTHDNDTQGDHGTHVSGISCANLYVPTGSGFDKQETGVVGVAPDAQLLTMKVFGTKGGAYTDDYMAAIEDALLLDADVVNLSLGSSSAGNSADAETYVNEIFDALQGTDTVVSISAGNAGRWSDNSAYGANLSSDVNLDTVGSPGSYTNAFTVASADNSGYTGYSAGFNGDTDIWYNDAAAKSIATLDTSADRSGTEFDYVLLTGVGVPEDYAGIDVTGKVVLVSRGEISFAEKHSNGSAAGAAALFIYNNEAGSINMSLEGSTGNIPCASILLSDAQAIVANATQVSEGVFTGKVKILNKVTTNPNAAGGYGMSDFSSVGVPGSLELKPEITAPGGNIYSTLDDGQYGLMSGTSMAAPSVAGMSALVTQYIKENGLAEKTGLSVRTLAQSLLMSTAVPLAQDENTEYSPRSQGAGLGQVELATKSPSYILFGAKEGNDGKVKAELGDDAGKTGVYNFDFTVYNMSDEKQFYTVDSSVLTEELLEDAFIAGVSHKLNPTIKVSSTQLLYDLNNDLKVDELDAAVFLAHVNGSKECDIITAHKNNEFDFNKDGLIDTADVHNFLKAIKLGNFTAEDEVVGVEANGSTNVSVTVTLSAEDKAYLNGFENGMYVDGFIYLKNDIADLSVPMLGFYGSWADSSMYDPFDFLEFVNNGDNWEYPYSISDPNNFDPTNFLTLAYAGSSSKYYYAGNMYSRNGDEAYLPERNAFSSEAGNTIVAANYTLIRNAARVITTITNADDGTVYYQKAEGEKDAEYYHANQGAWQNVLQTSNLNWKGTDAEGKPLPEGTKVNISVTAVPAYYDGVEVANINGKGLTWTVPMTIDNTKPEIVSVADASEAGKIDITVKDNRYVAAISVYDSDKTTLLGSADINQTEAGAETVISFAYPESVFYLRVYDYAGNTAVYRVNKSGQPDTTVAETITLSQTTMELLKGSQNQLIATVGPVTLMDDSVVWTSSNQEVATVTADGLVSGLSDGKATITATTNAKDSSGKALTATCEVEVKTLSVDLNGIVWDSDSKAYWSSFNSGKFADYTKLSGAQPEFMSAALLDNGKLFAATFDDDQSASKLCVVDPSNGYSTQVLVEGATWCTDMAYSEGTGLLYASYGPYIQVLNPANGEVLGAIDTTSKLGGDYVIGAAYVGTGAYQNQYAMDILYLVTRTGVLAQLGFIPELNGSITVPIGDTGVNPNNMWYFNSLYYDSESDYIFWSMFNGGSVATLYAIKDTYIAETDEDIITVSELGSSAEGVWPVAGLYRSGAASANNAVAAERMMAAFDGITLDTELIADIPAVNEPVTGK